jgi:hypothetical protein
MLGTANPGNPGDMKNASDSSASLENRAKIPQIGEDNLCPKRFQFRHGSPAERGHASPSGEELFDNISAEKPPAAGYQCIHRILAS